MTKNGSIMQSINIFVEVQFKQDYIRKQGKQMQQLLTEFLDGYRRVIKKNQIKRTIEVQRLMRELIQNTFIIFNNKKSNKLIDIMLHQKRKLNSFEHTKINLPSRFEIINWINDTLLLPLTKIQQLGAGNVYCQLLDAAYPEKVPLYKVKWNAKNYGDFVHNFKILQYSFERLGIEKMIEVQKLSQVKYQDNFEFIQWMKAFLEEKIDSRTYQPLKRRNYMKLDLFFARKKKFNLTLNANKENSHEVNQNSSHFFHSKQTSIRSSVLSQLNASKMELSYQNLTKRNQNFLNSFHSESKNKQNNCGKINEKQGIFVENIGIIESDEQDEQ